MIQHRLRSFKAGQYSSYLCPTRQTFLMAKPLKSLQWSSVRLRSNVGTFAHPVHKSVDSESIVLLSHQVCSIHTATDCNLNASSGAPRAHSMQVKFCRKTSNPRRSEDVRKTPTTASLETTSLSTGSITPYFMEIHLHLDTKQTRFNSTSHVQGNECRIVMDPVQSLIPMHKAIDAVLRSDPSNPPRNLGTSLGNSWTVHTRVILPSSREPFITFEFSHTSPPSFHGEESASSSYTTISIPVEYADMLLLHSYIEMCLERVIGFA